MKQNNSSQKGFTLVEMAVVILIVGLVVGSIFSFLSVQQEQKRRQVTMDRQKVIATAFTNFAQMRGRLPCPADPDVNETDNLYGTERTTCNTPATLKGLVPFRDLGLTQLDVTDGFDRPFTYVVANAARNVAAEAHRNCRENIIWVNVLTNANPPKAIFCCQRVNATDQLRVFRREGTANPADLAHNTQNDPPAGFAAAAVTQAAINFASPIGTLGAIRDNTHYLNYFAYVLISHGSNGQGAYRFPLGTVHTSATIPFVIPISAAEQANADTNMDFVDMPLNSAEGTNYFDDILLWRTQQSVISGLNNDSCARP